MPKVNVLRPVFGGSDQEQQARGRSSRGANTPIRETTGGKKKQHIKRKEGFWVIGLLDNRYRFFHPRERGRGIAKEAELPGAILVAVDKSEKNGLDLPGY